MQSLHIQTHFPGFSFHIHRGVARWRRLLQPRDVSPQYEIEIEYKWKKLPRARVIRPKLVPDAPHRYGDGTLCLYWPQEWHWSADQLIAATMIPWTALWLLYYELWLDTGKWLGTSSHQQVSHKEFE